MKHIFSCLVLSYSVLFLPLAAAAPDSTPMQQSILTPKASDQASQGTPATMNTPMTDELQTPTYEGTFTKMLLTLAGLLTLVFVTVWLLRKLTQGKIGAFGKKQINVIERRPLSPKSVLYIIEVSGKQILVAESQLEIKTLATIDNFSEEHS